MKNILYCYDGEQQLDPNTLMVDQGEVINIIDTEGEPHTGDGLVVLTPRDFIYVKDLDLPLSVGDIIYLDNQSHQEWKVCHGWYSVDGNPAICGWYLESVPAGRIRSLYQKDLQYLTIKTSQVTIVPPRPVKE